MICEKLFRKGIHSHVIASTIKRVCVYEYVCGLSAMAEIFLKLVMYVYRLYIHARISTFLCICLQSPYGVIMYVA